MEVLLCNPSNLDYGAVTIPLPIPDTEYERCIRMLEEIEIGDVTAHDCYLDQIHDAPPVLSILEGTRINIDELDFLARSLERLDETELAEFQAMAHLKEYRDVQDLINLSFNTGTHTVITGFSDLESVGKRHYLTTHGGGVPVEEMDQVNGIGVALGLIASGEGKVTPYGVLYGSDWPMEPVYSGYAFPPYWDQEYLMEFTLASPQHGDVYLLLPTPESRLERLLFRSGVSTPDSRRIKDWDSALPDTVLEHMNVTLESLEELNRLCAAVADLDEHDLKLLEAAVQYANPRSAGQIRSLAENLDLFEFFPGVNSAEDYGRYLIQESGHYDYDDNLEPYYDYTLCGDDQMVSETGGYVNGGYVVYQGAQELAELMQQKPEKQTQELQMAGF
jgi:hypothetical protein